MTILILGLLVFFASHSFCMLRARRAAAIASMGEGTYKVAFSLVSLAGLVLIVWGYGQYRAVGYIPVWNPPVWTKHLALLLMLPAMILLVAAYVPGEIKRRLKHPMLVAVKTWAVAHLLANGDLGSIVLFGSFLAWAVVDRISVKRRAEPSGLPIPNGGLRNDAIAVIVGLVLYGAIVRWLHTLLIGVPVIG